MNYVPPHTSKIYHCSLMISNEQVARKIFEDKASGAKTDRPGLREALEYVREGDTLLVWRLDRLGRSLIHLIETVAQLEEQGIGFRSLQEPIDTTSSGGRLVFQIYGVTGRVKPRCHGYTLGPLANQGRCTAR